MRSAWALAVLVLGAALSGCIGSSDDLDTQAGGVRPGSLPLPDSDAYDRSGDFSRVLETGPFAVLPGLRIDVESPVDGVALANGVFLPEIEGCDWEASSLQAECKLPVIIEAGPYYGNGDVVATEPADRLGRFLIENLVPHGYAVVQSSVRGTGWSGGCNDFLGPKEQADMDGVVAFFGEVPWSNGNVGIIGRSYDGTTPWEAATFGNPHLKTIVPISGLSDVGGMYFRNGSSEARAPFLGTVYTSFGASATDQEPGDQLKVACSETAEHPVFGTVGYLNGGGSAPTGEMDYWAVRNYQPRVLENYKGSVWMIHGLQDWNVDPHMAFPFAAQLMDAGLEVKVWAGQWQHNYPDRPGEHEHLRWDWAEVARAWFDRELKGLDVDTGPVVESEDNYGNWRALDAWPPRDVAWSTFYLSPGNALTPEAVESGEFVLSDPPGAGLAPCVFNEGNPVLPDNGMCLTLASEAFAADTHIVGLPRLHVTVTPSSNGGQLYAELFEDTGGDLVKFGHAQMDLRYHAGGSAPQVVAPGMPITAMMEFFPLDATVHTGSSIVLVLRQQHVEEPLPAAQQTPIMVSLGEGSTLSLPIGDAGNVHYVSEGVDPASTWS